MFHSAGKLFNVLFLLSFFDGAADFFDEAHLAEGLNGFEGIIEEMGVGFVVFAGEGGVGGEVFDGDLRRVGRKVDLHDRMGILLV